MITILTLIFSFLSLIVGVLSFCFSFFNSVGKVNIRVMSHEIRGYENNDEYLDFYIRNISDNPISIKNIKYFSDGKEVKILNVVSDPMVRASSLSSIPICYERWVNEYFPNASNVDELVIYSYGFINGISKSASFSIPKVNSKK